MMIAGGVSTVSSSEEDETGVKRSSQSRSRIADQVEGPGPSRPRRNGRRNPV